jgi:hypothetical protein
MARRNASLAKDRHDGSRAFPSFRTGRAITVLLLAACILLGAALYTSVGHAGASAYIALMALFGLAPAVMRPTALATTAVGQVATFTGTGRPNSKRSHIWRTARLACCVRLWSVPKDFESS